MYRNASRYLLARIDGARIIRLDNYPYANLGGQHDTRFLPGGQIGLFDTSRSVRARPPAFESASTP